MQALPCERARGRQLGRERLLLLAHLAARRFGCLRSEKACSAATSLRVMKRSAPRAASHAPRRFANGAAELVRLKVDIIVIAGGDTTIRAAKDATKTIPIVMVGSGGDPVEAGFIESLARPGGNVTGMTNLIRELGGKRLELLKEAVPKLSRVAVLYDAANAGNVRDVKEVLPAAARALGLTVKLWEVRAADDFEKVFAALNKQRPDGLYVTGGPLINANGKRIADFALKNRLPSVYARREAVEAGGLIYYGADLADSYRRVAYPWTGFEGSQACRSACGATHEV